MGRQSASTGPSAGNGLPRPLSPNSLADARAELARAERHRLDEAVAAGRSGGRLGVEAGPAEVQLDRLTQLVDDDAVSVLVADCVLWQADWNAERLGRLSELIGADRWLVFLEPVADLGWRYQLSRRFAARDRRRHGHDFVADVPRDLRRAGLTVTTTVRFDVGRRLTYAWGEARHYPTLDGPTYESPGTDAGHGAAERRSP